MESPTCGPASKLVKGEGGFFTYFTRFGSNARQVFIFSSASMLGCIVHLILHVAEWHPKHWDPPHFGSYSCHLFLQSLPHINTFSLCTETKEAVGDVLLACLIFTRLPAVSESQPEGEKEKYNCFFLMHTYHSGKPQLNGNIHSQFPSSSMAYKTL